MPHLIRAVRTATSGAALLFILISVGRLSAQADGSPIRLQTAAKPGKWITGRTVGITADPVGVVQSYGAVLTRTYDTLRFARAELHRIEVSGGHRSNVGRGALIGGGVGCEAGGKGAVLTLGFGGLGALAGALSHHEIWKEVPVSPEAGILNGQ